eukprot:UN08974
MKSLNENKIITSDVAVLKQTATETATATTPQRVELRFPQPHSGVWFLFSIFLACKN